jgi:hypothetical protein
MARTLGAAIEMAVLGNYDVVVARREDDHVRATYCASSGNWVTVVVEENDLVVYAPTATTHFAIFHEEEVIWEWPPNAFANTP